MEGISTKTIVKFFTEKTSDDVKKFFGVFPSNFVPRFISFHSMLIDSGMQYLFFIMNTDRSEKKVCIGGVSLIYTLKKRSFYSIVLRKASKALRN